MKHVLLSNGVKMPMLGFGVFQIPDPQQCKQAVLDAIAAGYRLIDTAAAYGNEEAVGEAIRCCDVPREELFITTKLALISIEGAYGLLNRQEGLNIVSTSSRSPKLSGDNGKCISFRVEA